jgi:uncharacterized protein (DUF885 family)
MLYAEQFRAARLVVDAGPHDKGWTKRHRPPRGSRQTRSEVEGYGLARSCLGYRSASSRFATAHEGAGALGPAFDVRAFHDELLVDGALPLSILEAKMDRWIDAQKSRRP